MANGKPMRADPEFVKTMKELARIRYDKGLSNFHPKELGTAEITRLAMRSPYWKNVVEDLKTKPKKENLPRGNNLF